VTGYSVEFGGFFFCAILFRWVFSPLFFLFFYFDFIFWRLRVT
jgi:hypothetical protein